MSNSFQNRLRTLVSSFQRPSHTFVATGSITLGADLSQAGDHWMWAAAHGLIRKMGLTDRARVKRPLNTDEIVVEFEDESEGILYWLTMPTDWH